MPSLETFKALKYMLIVCRILRAEVLVLQTPPSLKFTEENITAIKQTLLYLKQGSITIAWEARTSLGTQIPLELYELMEELDIIPVVDLSRFDPPPRELIYGRIFGGLKPMTISELQAIYKRVNKSIARKVYVCFHGARMYRDAGLVSSLIRES